jgi:murein DD-endopeptidase MepM/ murein hydrolase activator NlpD
VDLADTAPGSKVARAGRGVQALLAGRVAAVIQDRFPFGNALIIETPLQGQSLPPGFAIPTQAPTPVAIQSLTCPAPAPRPAWDFSAPRSLYILYAHMQKPPAFQVGDELVCGQTIGLVGMSGNALNPHLHFETRLGPPGLSFASLAHYDVSASPEEMSAYCDWSVRGVFQLVDPQPWIELVK